MATLKELRREVGKRLSDLIVAVETMGGSDVTFVDSSRLLAGDNAYRGRWLYFTGGTVLNLGASRKVTASTSASGTLNFTPNLPADTAINDEAELWGVHGQGFLPQEVNDMLISVNDDAMQNNYTPLTASVTAAFDRSLGYVALPATITVGIIDLEYQTPFGDWTSVDRASNRGGPGYWVTRGSGQLVIGGDYWLGSMDGASLRVVGYGTGTPLSTDASTTAINKEFLIWEACYRLALAGLERNPELNRTRMQVFEREAKIARQRARGRGASDWVRV